MSICPGLLDSGNAVDSYGWEGDQKCTEFCEEGWFAQNSSRLCQSYCPLDEYGDIHQRRCVQDCDQAIPEFADNTTNLCVGTCPETPDMFADLDLFVCVENCPADLWAANLSRACEADCEPMFADNYTRRCVWYCPAHLDTYADNETFRCVDRCPEDS